MKISRILMFALISYAVACFTISILIGFFFMIKDYMSSSSNDISSTFYFIWLLTRAIFLLASGPFFIMRLFLWKVGTESTFSFALGGAVIGGLFLLFVALILDEGTSFEFLSPSTAFMTLTAGALGGALFRSLENALLTFNTPNPRYNG